MRNKKERVFGALGQFLALALGLFLLILPAFAQVSVERDATSYQAPGREFSVSIKVNPDGADGFDVAELIPKGWPLLSWEISGYERSRASVESRERAYLGKNYTAYHWKLSSKPETEFEITYTSRVPQGAQIGNEEKFSTLWTYPGGFGSKNSLLRVSREAAPVCGDSTCSEGESCSSCPKDCGVCWTPVCGDSTCSQGECSSCPSDCKSPDSNCPPANGEAPLNPGNSIFGNKEASEFLSGIAMPAIFTILALAALVLIFLVGRRFLDSAVRSSEVRRMEEAARLEAEKARPRTLSELSSRDSTVPASSASLKDQVFGRVEVKAPPKAASAAPLTPEKRIAALKKTMIKISKVAEDIGKST